MRSGELEVDGFRLHHMYGGRGSPPLLLIHGLGSASYIEWRFNLAPLAETNRVLAPDLPGFGRSEKPAARYGVPFFARTIERYLDQLEVGRVNVVGASLGGRVAIELAVRRRPRIEKLVLVNSLGLGRPRMQPFYPLVTLPRVGETVMRLMGTGMQRASPELLKRVIKRYLGSAAELDKVVDDVYLADLREMHLSERYPEAYLATVRSLMNPTAIVT
jgi:pimeloyl-ACP methyl ester carboxylesterase